MKLPTALPPYRPTALLALLIVALATPLRAQPAAPSRLGQLLAAERAVSDSASSGRFAAALTGVMTTDATYLHPGAPVIIGADRSRTFLEAHPGMAGLTVQWQTLHAEVSADSSLGVSWGVATARPIGGAARIGKYLAAWTHTGGQWRLAAIAFLGVLPPAPEPAMAGLPVVLPALPAAGSAAPFVMADLAFSAAAGRSGAAAAFYSYAASDAVMFPGSGLLVRGRTAIRASLAGGTAAWRWHPVSAGGTQAGDLGFTVGEAEITATGPDGARETYWSKYLTLWRREGGAWRFLADGGSARPAPPTAAAR